ncbi:MAG: squalene synthase HpnC [Pseudomonadota bacterium]
MTSTLQADPKAPAAADAPSSAVALGQINATASVDGRSALETPSGKNASTENFPVGSFLLPKALRPHVATFYAYARAIDDIADNGAVPADERIRRLRAFDAALTGEAVSDGAEKAVALRQSLSVCGVTNRHGRDLIAAFIQDCEKSRYETWDELIGYCALSANPVGRYLLDLHGEDPAGYKYSDALCTVLQIVNHLQDCGDDRRDMDRVYIVQSWLRAAGGDIDLIDKLETAPPLRATIDQMLDGCEQMMLDARRLPGALKSRRLAMESAIIVRLADRLITLLRNGDPLATRVALSKLDFVSAGFRGAIAGFLSAGRGAVKP